MQIRPVFFTWCIIFDVDRFISPDEMAPGSGKYNHIYRDQTSHQIYENIDPLWPINKTSPSKPTAGLFIIGFPDRSLSRLNSGNCSLH